MYYNISIRYLHAQVKSAWKQDETGNLKGAAAWISQIIAVELYF